MISIVFKRVCKIRFTLLIVLQLGLLLVLGGNGIQYCGNMEIDKSVENKKGNHIYYSLCTNSAKSSSIKWDDPLLIQKMHQTLLEIRESKEPLYLVVSPEQYVAVKEKEIMLAMNIEDYLQITNFLPFGDWVESIGSSVQTRNEHILEINNEIYTYMKSAKIDRNAMIHYEMGVQEGELFEEEDFIYEFAQKEISVLLGAAYIDYYEPGDQISIYSNGKKLSGVVKGILKCDTVIKNDMTFEHLNNVETTLDYSIILPYLQFAGETINADDKGFASVEYVNQLTGTIVFNSDTSKKEINNVLVNWNQCYMKNDIFTVKYINSSNGHFYFQTEDMANINLLMLIFLGIYATIFLSIGINLANNIKHNEYEYSVLLLQGMSERFLKKIYVIYILLIYLCGIILMLYVHPAWLHQGMTFWFVFILGILVELIAVIVYIMRRVDNINTEIAIRG